jgi:Protein of unknown function (DUF1592)/Protein of unknown function (DUF1588)/Protein of unknown function (DUF1595)/Protein of unknown function (DUF1587)/Protein of unknown function (DUF1585)
MRMKYFSPRSSWLTLAGPLMLSGVYGCLGDVEGTHGAAPGSASAGSGTGASGNASGGSGNGAGSAGVANNGGDLSSIPAECLQAPHPGSAPVRRLTRFEYNNAVRDLLGDASEPANALPPETIGRTGNVFGNDASLQSVSTNLADGWGSVAEGVAARATASPEALGKLAACASAANPDDTCARGLIEGIAARAYRRTLTSAESDGFLALEKQIQSSSGFASGIAAVIEAVLQGPEFLYRVEFGTAVADHPELRRPTSDEMATRLSFLFWGTLPDEALRTAAKNGDLASSDGVKAQAQRLVDAPQARPVVRFFFDNLLPISGLTNLARSKTLFPAYTQPFAAALREETQQFLEHEIFDPGSAGTWTSALTAPYTYVNDQLAAFYGISGVQGADFRKVALPDITKRLGLLTQGSIMTGTITTNESNPVLRGSFMLNKIMCMNIALPTDPAILAQVKVPEGVNGTTARQRFSQHSAQPICASCHQFLDPVGFALENYDPIGQWRDQDQGITIDASGKIPGQSATVNGPIELIKGIAGTEQAQNCFAQHWLEFGYGKTLADTDACTQAKLNELFKKSGGNVKQLLVNLTQTDAFLYLPAKD